ncbi:hypothetical protein DNTS_014491 [Danionella cerebrum]|uniref:Palmitoyltransferase n=1 Tax=Danionella cerebrum TaxID=2873325 RepID=A0A553R3K8_9TELE|nr:hypothetical protein DNTS_014491 [Danionella translucida]
MFKSMFKSGCFIRTAHTIFTWFVTLVLSLHNTDLRRCQERGDLLQPLTFLCLVLLSLLLYFIVSLMDPGFVMSDSETKQPMRARHCKTCKQCVRRFDHHCPWLENCVGEKNHRCFLIYLCVQFSTVAWASQTAWSGLVFFGSWSQAFHQNWLLLVVFALTAILSVVLLLLICIHLYLASINTTTWEFMSRHRILYLKHCDSEENPFDRGLICNLWDFCCVCGTVAWEKIYIRHNSPSGSI